ncbi:MAG: DUF4358 domain-containing protein [Clostridia bacterium]|nr:DUF4358 domain-containing protein [Clostridia bacterium]
MKKSICIVFAALLALTAAFAACTKPADKGEPATAAQLWEKVCEVSGFGEMTALPKSDYLDIYGIDTTKLADSVWYMSSNPSLNADEVAIFKLSDASYRDELVQKLEARIARQLDVAKSYSPAEASKLEAARVVTDGDFVYYCVGDASDAMMKVLKNTNK